MLTLRRLLFPATLSLCVPLSQAEIRSLKLIGAAGKKPDHAFCDRRRSMGPTDGFGACVEKPSRKAVN